MLFEKKLGIGKKRIELWKELVETGEKISGNKLSEASQSQLVFAFELLFKDNSLVGAPIVIMYDRANKLSGRLKAEELERVGNISLMRAGFLPLVSRNFRKVMGHTVPYFISFGRNSFYGAKITYQSSNRRALGSFYDTLVDEFVLLVEVLWALQKDGYPELLELIEVSGIAGARHAKEKVQQLTRGILLDVNFDKTPF